MPNRISDIFALSPGRQSAGPVSRGARVAQRVWRCWAAAMLSVGMAVLAPPVQAGFPNGGFESDLTNWTVSSYLWSGHSDTIFPFPPTQESDLGLVPVASNGLTTAVGAGTDSQSGNALGYPLYGSKAARINYLGNNLRVSSIDQTAPMTLADVDPNDGKVHVRFAIAPVLQNPGHPANQQPYFFVEVTNVTKGNTQLFHTFNFSGQSGVPWVTVGGYQYTHWQAIDIAPGAGVLDVGDQVNVKIIGAGCGQGGHEGHVYVDSGPALSTLPGPYVYATGPQWATAGGTVTYTYTYGNSGTSPLTNTLVTVVSPQDSTASPKNLTFQSLSGTGTGSCSVPSVGVAGTITCNFGTYNPNNVGTFQITFGVPSPATGPINHGNYQVSGDNSPAILGPLVQTSLSGATPLVDLGVSISDGQSSVTWGQTLTYTIVVSNAGPATVPVGATVVEALPAQLVNATWTCASSGGTSCPNVTGFGAINETTTGVGTIPPGGTLTYTVTAQANPAGSGTGTINNAVTVTAPGGVFDSSSANNTAADVDNVGPALSTLTVNKSGAGSGTVSTVPGGINCGTACATANAQYPTGTDVVLYASAPAGSIFAGWAGGGCSGSASSCTVTLNSSFGVTADFAVPLIVHPVIGLNGTVSPGVDQPVVAGGSTSFTVTPASGYALQVTDNCASGSSQTGGALVGNTYTTNAIVQSCTINFNFINTGVYMVTRIVGANGSITPNANKTVVSGGTASYLVTPNSGYAPAIPTGTCAAGSWSGNAYSTGAVVADCDVSFSFVASVLPVPVADATNTVAGTAGTFDVSANDTKPSGATYSRTGGSCAAASVNSVGSASFTTPGTIGATCTVTYQVCNPAPDGATCASSTLTVTASAPALTALADATSTPTGTSATFDVAANDTKPVGATYSLTGGTCSTASVSSVGSAGFTAPTTAGNTCTVIYSVCDPAPNASTCASATLTVTAAAPAAPTANNDTVPHGVRTFSPAANDVASAGAVIDPSTLDLDPLTPGIQKGPVTTAQGTWQVIDNNGTVTFLPAVGFYGTATLTYAISDSFGGTATATISVPVDPSGVAYNSTTRLPVAGATVTLLYNGGSANAYVAGGNATFTTNAAGQYAFFLTAGAPAGNYSLTVSSAGYTFVSTAIPAAAGSWPATGGAVTSVAGAPSGGQPTTYYLSGPLLMADLTNNNIPLDPVPVALASIPTLSEYMMLMLSGLLLLFGLVSLRRRVKA